MINVGQNNRLLTWIEAMLSGDYKHGRPYLYNDYSKTHSSLGVALRCAGVHFGTTSGYQVYPAAFNKTVNSEWFANRFGLSRPPSFYNTVDAMSTSYLPVSALLLEACMPGDIREVLRAKMMEQYNAVRLAKA